MAGFDDVAVVDRRVKPSHGYRAVHLVIREEDKPIEVQIRTSLQHAWAEICEKLADVNDPVIKYGGGPAQPRRVLDSASRAIENVERMERDLAEAKAATAATAAITQRVRARRDELLELLQTFLNEPIEPIEVSE